MDSAIKTTYRDDVIDVNANTRRKFKKTENADGTISVDDVTKYLQKGDVFGAKELNAICAALLGLDKQLGGYTFAPTCTQAQYDAMPSHPDKTIYFTT